MDAFLPDLAGVAEQPGPPGWPSWPTGGRSDEAVQHYCGPAEKLPVFLDMFPMSLTSLGIRLTEMGNFEAALAADRGAVSLYTELIALDPVHYRDALGRAVDNLVIDLRDLRRTEQEVADELDRLSLPGR